VSVFFGYGTVSLPVVILRTPGFTGHTRCREGREEKMLSVMNSLTRKHAGGAKRERKGTTTEKALNGLNLHSRW